MATVNTYKTRVTNVATNIATMVGYLSYIKYFYPEDCLTVRNNIDTRPLIGDRRYRNNYIAILDTYF